MTNLLEVLALLGMVHMRGILGQELESTKAIFYEIFGNPVFSVTMSINRFKFLIFHITMQGILFIGNTIDLQIFVKFSKNLTKAGKFLVLDNYLSLDETLYPTRAPISFKQFNQSKP